MYRIDVDLENREEMIKFLCNHFRYATLNGWNGNSSYANNVKMQNLQSRIPEQLRAKAWDFVLSDCDMSELNSEYDWLIEEFRNDTGWDAGFNGRSCGYVVLYDTEWDYKGDKPVLNTVFRSVDDNDPEYFEDWYTEDIRERVKIVQRFDQLCDDMLDTLIYFLENYDIVEEEYTVVETRRILQEAIA